MNFRDLLLLVVALYGSRQGNDNDSDNPSGDNLLKKGFQAKEFSSVLLNYLFSNGYAAKHPDLILQCGPKRISNDLRRLYHMGFLSRSRIKRMVRTRTKKCHKGYCYLYKVTKQGLAYFEFLVDPKQARANSEKDPLVGTVGISRKRVRIDHWLGQEFSEDRKDILFGFEMRHNNRSGRSKRFPLKYGPSLAHRYLVAMKLLKRHGVTEEEFHKELAILAAYTDGVYPELNLVNGVLFGDAHKTTLDSDADTKSKIFAGLLDQASRQSKEELIKRLVAEIGRKICPTSLTR